MTLHKSEIVEVVHKNFIITSFEKLIKWARSSSLWSVNFSLSCCSLEMLQATNNFKDDLASLGVKLQANPSQADVLIVTGALTNKMAPILREVYDQMSFPKWVISVGSCANGGGSYYASYSVVKGCDRIIPVDIYVPGCPPTPEALIYGIIQLQNKIKSSNNINV